MLTHIHWTSQIYRDHFIKGCSGFDSGRSYAATDFLRRLPTSNVVVWIDDSVPYPLGAEGAGV